MKVIITVREAMEKRVWDAICDIKGWSVYCVDGGLLDLEEEISLSEDAAQHLGLLEEK